MLLLYSNTKINFLQYDILYERILQDKSIYHTAAQSVRLKLKIKNISEAALNIFNSQHSLLQHYSMIS